MAQVAPNARTLLLAGWRQDVSGTAAREAGKDGRKALCPDWSVLGSFCQPAVWSHFCAQMSKSPNTCWMGFTGYPGLQKHCRSVHTQKYHQDPSPQQFLVTENTGLLSLPCLILTTEKLCTSVHAMLKWAAAAAAERLCVPRWSPRPS